MIYHQKAKLGVEINEMETRKTVEKKSMKPRAGF